MNIIYASKLRKVNDVQIVLPQTCSSTDSIKYQKVRCGLFI